VARLDDDDLGRE
jgi:hypothetical protein